MSKAPPTPHELPELYQAEWCPYSRLVRQRLTELEVDYIARQAPADRAKRDAVRARSGQTQIPVLVDHTVVVTGSDAILTYLDRTYPVPPQAAAHRTRATEKRQEYLNREYSELNLRSKR